MTSITGWLLSVSLLPFTLCLSTLLILMGSCMAQRLTLSKACPGFYVSAAQVFRKHCGKGRNCALNEQFLLFPQSFLLVWRTFCHFHQIQKCRLQTLCIWTSLKFVIWDRVNCRTHDLEVTWGMSLTRSIGHVLGQDTSEPRPRNGEAQDCPWIYDLSCDSRDVENSVTPFNQSFNLTINHNKYSYH